MKAMVVATFFMLLFFLAGTIGLPVPVGLVFVFFVTIAAPAALVLSLISVSIFKLATKGNEDNRWPFFDIGLQTFIMLALFATGGFVLWLPGGLQESYPSIREEVARQLSPDHTPEDKEKFLISLDRFWEWNVKFLLQEETPPSEVQQQNVRETVSLFGESLAPACETCEPQLTLPETRRLTGMMNTITTAGVTTPTEKTLGTTAMLSSPGFVTNVTTATTSVTAATGITSPAAVTQAP